MSPRDALAEWLAAHPRCEDHLAPIVRAALDATADGRIGRRAIPEDVFAALARVGPEQWVRDQVEPLLWLRGRTNGALLEQVMVPAACAEAVAAVMVAASRLRGGGDLAAEERPIVLGGTKPIGRGGLTRLTGRNAPPRVALEISGGWLRRPVQVAPADGCPLGWMVAAWLVLRPGAGDAPAVARIQKRASVAEVTSWGPVPEAKGDDEGFGHAVLRAEGDGDEDTHAWGWMRGADLARAGLEGRGVILGEREAAALAEAEAAAVRARDAEKLRLPGEREALAQAVEDLRKSCDEGKGVGDPTERAVDRECVRLAEGLAGDRADSDLLVRLRAEVQRQDGWRRSQAYRWRTLIEREARAVVLRREGEAEAARWRDWPRAAERARVEGRGAGSPRWASEAARQAAAWLVGKSGPFAGRVGAGEGADARWRRWACRSLAWAGLREAEKQHPARTEAGKEALVGLRAALGVPDAAQDGDRLTDAVLRDLRCALDEAAGLRVLRCSTLAEARRAWLGPEVARMQGRGDTAVVAERPGRVLVGPATAIVGAGYDRLENDGGAVLATRSARWGPEGELDLVTGRGVVGRAELDGVLRVARGAVALGEHPPPLREAVAAALATGGVRLPRVDRSGWRPVVAELERGDALPCEVREDGDGLRVRWEHRDDSDLYRVEVVLREDDADVDLERAGVPVKPVEIEPGLLEGHVATACEVRAWLGSERRNDHE